MISVLMTVYNDEKYIADAINAVLRQNYEDFEFILIDDCSTDSSYRIIKSFEDKRIKLYHNRKKRGIVYNRNKSVKLAKGKYLFFTDSDCIVDKEWIKQGLKHFNKKDCLGVEGLTYYIRKGYNPTLSDKTPGTCETPGHYMTCNIVYRKDAIKKVKEFNEKFTYNSDREIALKIKKNGKIYYNNNMKVTHQKKIWTLKEYILSGKKIMNRVLLYKYLNESILIYHKIVYPKNLIKILFPPLILSPLFNNKVKNWSDLKILLGTYPKLIYERYVVWKTAIKEKIFLI